MKESSLQLTSHAAVALLHHDGEDEPSVDAGLVGDLLERVVDVVDLSVGVVGDAPLGTRDSHDLLVVVESGWLQRQSPSELFARGGKRKRTKCQRMTPRHSAPASRLTWHRYQST